MYQPGDLVLLPFPFAEMDAVKKRPVLILTAPDERGDFIGLAITSVPTSRLALEVTDDSLWEGCLPKRSWLRLDKIFSLNTHRVEGLFARVSPDFRHRAVQELCILLASRGMPPSATHG